MLFFIGLVLFLVLPSPWNDIALAVCLAGFGIEVYFWYRSVRRRRNASGPEQLIGRTATAMAECRPFGQVRLGGEIWEARCDEGASDGDTVVVTDRVGLTLIVSRQA